MGRVEPCVCWPYALFDTHYLNCGSAPAVCTENLNPDVMVMKPAKDRA
jgi:hypothetical protein